MPEQANISPSQLSALRIGIAEGVTAVLAMNQTAIVTALSSGERGAADLMGGLVNAIRDNREQFELQILGLALERFAPAEGEGHD